MIDINGDVNISQHVNISHYKNSMTFIGFCTYEMDFYQILSDITILYILIFN